MISFLTTSWLRPTNPPEPSFPPRSFFPRAFPHNSPGLSTTKFFLNIYSSVLRMNVVSSMTSEMTFYGSETLMILFSIRKGIRALRKLAALATFFPQMANFVSIWFQSCSYSTQKWGFPLSFKLSATQRNHCRIIGSIRVGAGSQFTLKFSLRWC